PSIPPCGFAVLVIPGKKAGFVPTGAVCRSCTPHACLHQPRAPQRGIGARTRQRHLAARSGSKGEAPWSPKAKSPFRKFAHSVIPVFNMNLLEKHSSA
ncbi:hypothetical protein, partial [Victivallis vadensis]|uniref:hypothetical protein n=1 Tax=Victivallis vadensis TaxID=172901 RepID=UPI00266B3DEF